ncbi:MAG: diguanylate cyclase [Methylococcaceae bacterium]|nr:diguanylate cyclase [Methylococcaceae bacterium]MDP2394476.1 diguanylate cyclase [Methylococcaceae bacterium]MDP3021519.1 diguanylate cyclase [Methylococcaceae bacterium]MDP3390362.1 diguanylate cyclase [Methylococcaceae bacterium]MDZ4155079.1 diguanylate cyclase [Methylococcales bacterium]
MSDNSNQNRLKQQLDTKEMIFTQTVPSAIAAISKAWQHCKSQLDAPAITTLLDELQQLAHASAAAGFLDIAEIAEASTETLSKTNTELPLLQIHSEQTLDVLFLALETAAHNIINKQNTNIPPYRRTGDEPLVVVMGDTDAIFDGISKQLNNEGIRTRQVSSIEQFLTINSALKPAVILIQLSSTTLGLGLSQIELLKHQVLELPSIVVIAEQDDIFSRLNAARAGAAAYFAHPLPINQMVEFIRSQQHAAQRSAYRVLIINDDATSAKQSLSIMQKNGIKTRLLTNPANVLATLIEFQPELILIDLHMRETNGLELAANIRHHYAYSSTAIVFWADDNVIDDHRNALNAADEEFFIKSMSLKQFIAAIEVKVKRSRIIQEMMVRDGLTGLLNRSTLDEHLQLEISKSKHHPNPFSYVMLNLDHFSTVNAEFGYQVGDEVLKALGALFNRRLRAVDTAARFGGEEVVLILPNTSANQAKLLVAELLRKFSTLKFSVNNRQFSVTFSAGIAEFPRFQDMPALIDAANQALYQAKTEGRNRVRLANC